MDVVNLNDTQSPEVSSSCSSSDTEVNSQQSPEQAKVSDDLSSAVTCAKNPNPTQSEETKQNPLPTSPDKELNTEVCSSKNCLTSNPGNSLPVLNSPKEVVDPSLTADSGERSDKVLPSEGSSSKAVEECVGKMVQGNGIGHLVRNNVSPENIAKFFAVPAVNNNLKITLGGIGSAFNSGCQGYIQKKENAFQRDYSCENRDSLSEPSNSDEDEDVEILDNNDGEEDWSFDEEEDAVTPGKQCPCAFKHPSASVNGSSKSPLKQQDSNQEKPSTSRSPLQTNPFFIASNVLSCPDCEQSFDCRVDLNRHRLKHITEKSFKCSHCDKSFAFSFNLKSHERQHTGEKPYVCNKCGLSFVHAFNFHEHQRVHNGRSHYVCNICLQWFSAESKYLLHIRRHSSIKPFKCSMCGKAFHRAAGLRAHELLHAVQKEDQQLFSCRYCDRTFVRIAHKQMHERVHVTEKLFPCLQCGKTYTDLSIFKAHACQQTNGKQHKCSVCSQVFPSSASLESHSKTHSSPKASSCKNTQERSSKFNVFKQKSPLTSAKKRYPCTLCSRAFSSKSLLDDHVKIHQREYTPYMCKECCLTFTHASYLKLHLSMHQDQASLQCKLCPQKFTSKSELESHSKVHANANAKGLTQGFLIKTDTGGLSPLNSPKSVSSASSMELCSTPSPMATSLPISVKSEPQ